MFYKLERKEEMSKVPYAYVVGSLMYVMVCTIPDIGHAVGVSVDFFQILEQNMVSGEMDT